MFGTPWSLDPETYPTVTLELIHDNQGLLVELYLAPAIRDIWYILPE